MCETAASENSTSRPMASSRARKARPIAARGSSAGVPAARIGPCVACAERGQEFVADGAGGVRELVGVHALADQDGPVPGFTDPRGSPVTSNTIESIDTRPINGTLWPCSDAPALGLAARR